MQAFKDIFSGLARILSKHNPPKKRQVLVLRSPDIRGSVHLWGRRPGKYGDEYREEVYPVAISEWDAGEWFVARRRLGQLEVFYQREDLVFAIFRPEANRILGLPEGEQITLLYDFERQRREDQHSQVPFP